jgi:hypothetical protein
MFLLIAYAQEQIQREARKLEEKKTVTKQANIIMRIKSSGII